MVTKVRRWQETKPSTLRSVSRSRQRLIEDMGGQCVYCGSAYNLHVHHVSERKWVVIRANRWTRVARYRREYALGQVVLACRRCNSLRGRPGG